MAKDQHQFTGMGWLERDKHIITGLDHLGIQTVSISLYKKERGNGD